MTIRFASLAYIIYMRRSQYGRRLSLRWVRPGQTGPSRVLSEFCMAAEAGSTVDRFRTWKSMGFRPSSAMWSGSSSSTSSPFCDKPLNHGEANA